MYRKNRGGVHLIPRVLGWGRSSSIERDVGDSSQEGILSGEKGVEKIATEGPEAEKKKKKSEKRA